MYFQNLTRDVGYGRKKLMVLPSEVWLVQELRYSQMGEAVDSF